MKRTARTLIVIAALLAASLAAAAVLYFTLRPPAHKWVSWRLDEEQVRSLESILPPPKTPGDPVIHRLDPNASLESQARTLSRSAILFTLDGLEPAFLAEKSALFAANATTGADSAEAAHATIADAMPSSQRKGGMHKGARYALPLLNDHGELAWQRASIISLGLEAPANFDELESALAKARSKGIWPLVAAGADDKALALFVAMLVEARYGQAALVSLAEALGIVAAASSGTPADYRALFEAEPLKGSIALLADWRRSAILHPEWFRLEERDIHALMEAKVAVFVAMSLSAHRRVPQRTIERYDSIYFPAAREFSRQRAFLAPTIIAVPLAGSKRASRDAIDFARLLVSQEVQSELSARSGLAPVHSSAEARDKQSGDARLWIAASNRPLPPLEAAFPTDAAFKEFAAQLREAIATAR